MNRIAGLRWLAAALVMSAALGACSSDSNDGDASGPVTLTLWHNSADPEPVLNLYKAYEEASGNKIELVDVPADGFENTTQTKWATGDRPDILEYHGIAREIQPLNPALNMIDLTGSDFIEKEGELGEVTGVLNGRVYAATIAFPQVFGIFYNKKVFEDTGLEPPQSYADVARICDTLKTKAPDVTPIFEAGGSGWPQQLMTYEYMAESNVDDEYGQAVAAGEVDVSDPDGPFVEALESYVALKEQDCYNSDATSATFEESLKAVLDGTAAMVVQHSDMISILNEYAGGDTEKADDAVGFVGVSATQPVSTYIPTPLGTYYLPKTGDSTKEAAARDFLDWITGPGYADYVKDAGTIPIFSGVQSPKLQGLTQDVQKAWENSVLLPSASIPGFNQFSAESQKLLAGQETPDGVAENMQAAVEQARAAIGQ